MSIKTATLNGVATIEIARPEKKNALTIAMYRAMADALHHLQHRRDQFRLRGQQHAQRDRQRQHPLPHRHVRDDVVDPVRSGLRHAPGAARGAESPALAAEGQQLVVAALAAA